MYKKCMHLHLYVIRHTLYVILSYETNVSAKEAQTRPRARIFEPHCYQKRSRTTYPPPPQGPCSSFSIKMVRAKRLSRAEFPTHPPRVRVSNELFSIALWRSNEGHETKFSCVVSKKVAARATDRNRLKRQCREIASPLVAAMKTSCAIVIYPKAAARDTPFAELRASITALLVKLKV